MSEKDKVTLSNLKKITSSVDKVNAELTKAESIIIYDKKLTSLEKEKQLENLYKEKTKLFKEIYKQINPIVKESKK